MFKALVGLMAAAGAAAGPVTELERTQHLERMGEAEVLQYEILDAVAAGSAVKAQAASARLVTTLHAERAYFAKGGVAEAIAQLETTIGLAAALADAAKASDLAEVGARHQALSEGCIACHGLDADSKIKVAP